MEKLFVSKEIAQKVKEKGFNELCLAYYDGEKLLFSTDNNQNSIISSSKKSNKVSAPLYQQVIDWIRTNYGWNLYVGGYESLRYYPDVDGMKTKRYEIDLHNLRSEDYYESLTKALNEVIRVID